MDAHKALEDNLTVTMCDLSEGGEQECGGSESLHCEGC